MPLPTIASFAVAILLGLIAVLLVRGILGGRQPAAAEASASMTPVVVAALPIERGVSLKPPMLKVVNYPRAAVPAGAKAFGAPMKLGEGTWMLKACPMDGGTMFTQGDDFSTVWQRDGAVFLARPGASEMKLSAGTQPVAASTARGSIAIWQQGADLWSAALNEKPSPTLFAKNGRFPSILSVPGGNRVIVAYERGNDSVVERVED